MAPPRPVTTVQLDERVYSTALDAGPLILSEQVPGVRSVAVGVWVRWGASHDPPDQMGASHLLEHLIFKGTERRSARDIAMAIEALGGSLDAYTSREHMACYAKVLDEHLPVAVEILTDLVFRPLLREADLELERKVVLEEIAGVEDNPEELVFDLHARALWGDHPYGNPVLGTRETVGGLTRSDLQRLWEGAYRPGVCVVAAAGNLQHDEFVRLVERHFPRERRESVQPPLPEPPPALPGEQRVPRDSAQVHICLGAQTFPHRDPRRYASILIATALGGGMSSRLFQRVREKLGLVYAIFTYQSFYAQAGLSGIYMATGPDGAERALAEVRSELESLAASGLPADELESVKNQTKGQLVLTLESTSARLQRLAGVALYNEPFLTPDDICARIDAVSEAEVAELCREYYAAGRQVVVRLGPDGESRP